MAESGGEVIRGAPTTRAVKGQVKVKVKLDFGVLSSAQYRLRTREC